MKKEQENTNGFPTFFFIKMSALTFLTYSITKSMN